MAATLMFQPSRRTDQCGEEEEGGGGLWVFPALHHPLHPLSLWSVCLVAPALARRLRNTQSLCLPCGNGSFGPLPANVVSFLSLSLPLSPSACHSLSASLSLPLLSPSLSLPLLSPSLSLPLPVTLSLSHTHTLPPLPPLSLCSAPYSLDFLSPFSFLFFFPALWRSDTSVHTLSAATTHGCSSFSYLTLVSLSRPPSLPLSAIFNLSAFPPPTPTKIQTQLGAWFC